MRQRRKQVSSKLFIAREPNAPIDKNLSINVWEMVLFPKLLMELLVKTSVMIIVPAARVMRKRQQAGF